MPSYRSKYAKKPRKSTYAQYKAKKVRKYKRTLPANAQAHVPSGFQILNKNTPKSHYFEDSFTSGSTVGSGIDFSSIIKFNMSLLGRYSTLKAMYRQYRVKYLKIRISMLQIENTDGNTIPEIFIRYNYDPDLAVPLSLSTMLSQQNVVWKRMLQGDGGGADLEYKIRPAVIVAQRIVNSTNFTHAPKFNQWCDFQSAAVNEVEHMGMAMYVPNIPTGVTLTYKYTVGYECRDVI